MSKVFFSTARTLRWDYHHSVPGKLEALLEKADFSGARLIDVSMKGANLMGASFARATLVGVDLRDAALAGADFTGTTAIGCQFPAGFER